MAPHPLFQVLQTTAPAANRCPFSDTHHPCPLPWPDAGKLFHYRFDDRHCNSSY